MYTQADFNKIEGIVAQLDQLSKEGHILESK